MDQYRSGVGMLLYLVKHSRPDISNPVRELSKAITKASSTQYSEMLRIMKYVDQTKNFGLKMKVTKAYQLVKDESFALESVNSTKLIMWYIHAYCDASYASDKDKRRSVTGFIIYFLWRSCFIQIEASTLSILKLH
mmetsp:Transcript_23925/g.36370  ORF Transcript_23925/g.36370 Transcript_23925/m.36370 type:complete len:136 (+) Transcript_23925:1421-1828(+)